MNAKNRIRKLIKSQVVILDGAIGTELQKGGMPTGICPETWCLENSRVLTDIYRVYDQAGADIVYTSTFGANRCKLAHYGVHDVRTVNRDLARLAKNAGGKNALVAGDIGPTGRFVAPFGDLAFEEAVEIFKEQVAGLLAGGVDLFVIETMIDIQEARAALLAVKETCDYFTIVTMTYEKDGRTLNGTDPVTALITLQSLGADAVGCNCSSGPETMLALVAAMKPYATVPLVAKPNAGMPHLEGNRTVFDMDDKAFAAFGQRFAEAGVNMLGGCCGTTPAHIRSLKQSVADSVPIGPRRKSLSAVSSARSYRLFTGDQPLQIVGERLNPTGKKALQQELREGKMTLVRQMAREQEELGAALLDVNVGVPGLDEVKAIRDILDLLAVTTSIPLVVDSSRAETIEAALRRYPGRALINSISGEKVKMVRLLPLAAKYGAMFIMLPLTEGEIPATVERRREVIKDIFRAARKFGFTKDDVIVDGLVMTVASDAQAAIETLKTIAWCTERFQCRTLLGVSNVSFGMPERQWVNAAFLAMAQALGLTLAIANPGSAETMNIKMAGDLLLKKDRDAASYIARFSRSAAATTQRTDQQAPPPDASPAARVARAIREGDREDVAARVEEALLAGVAAKSLVDESMIPAIVRVGDLYDQKVYFLPQLIASAEAMKLALAIVEPLLGVGSTAVGQKGTVILATVMGDIHDIGKNIVALMLRNHGYQIVDLGKNVPTEDVIAAMKKHQPQAVGLSALMTTTMVNMQAVIERAAREGLQCPFMVGGAVVTRDYASSLGAAYAKDGVEAVRVLEGLIKNRAKTGGAK
ncbi:MAG: homocysteine S-methyltransferase family protein [Deltaproteobacteria bacterium]|nr:homocysteine S-methyltransferase family protein [Deltaproteobacteria bacterium]